MPKQVTPRSRLEIEHEISKLSDLELYELIARAPSPTEGPPHSGAPLSVEQRAQVALDRRPDIRRAVRKYRNSATIAFTLLFMGLLATSYIAVREGSDDGDAIVDSGNRVAVTSCNSDYITILTLREEFKKEIPSFDLFVAEGTITTAQGERLKDRTRETLRVFTLPDCRSAAKAVTKNTDSSVLPEPLYPGSEAAKRLPQTGG